MRRNIDRRLQRLEARFVSPVKPPDFRIDFVAPGGEVVNSLWFRGDEEIWKIPPDDLEDGPEFAGKDGSRTLENTDGSDDVTKSQEAG